MSTEPTRREHVRQRRTRAFVGAFAAVLAVLGVTGLAGAAASSAQGPRVTHVQIDPGAGVAVSGSRLIVTTNQSLEKVDPAQVRVTPATPFTIDTSGRSVGLRFTLPLRDDARYTVRITDVAGRGGGPATTIAEHFRTPPLSAFLLRRSPAGDVIVRTGLTTGTTTTVFRSRHIEDFRATSGHLVVSTLDNAGHAVLLVTDLEGRHQRELPVPGPGTIMSLQAADRGELIGYTFFDADLGSGGTRESALYVASAKDEAATKKPTAVDVPGKEKRVADWRFVPDTDSILVLTYNGTMLLSAADGAGATDLGKGLAIDGIARGASVAVIQKADGMAQIDLTDGKQQPLVAAKEVAGVNGIVTPLPGAHAGTVRPTFVFDDANPDAGVTNLYRVAVDGTATKLYTVGAGDVLMHTCLSPSGRYAAVLVAPHVVDNPYDRYLLPIPRTVETRIIELADGHEVTNLEGFDLSWCQVPPPLVQ
ncbi:hypothetical protein [Microbacterium deminutum]|uniref:SbsA Ig-like domain-containing protein n=1 Tax=Microbacterium deminutum TaxID=344164 RepID=A0ABP5CL70_9MICO